MDKTNVNNEIEQYELDKSSFIDEDISYKSDNLSISSTNNSINREKYQFNLVFP